MSKHRQSDTNGMGDHGKYGHNVENFKRRRALPIPVMGDAKFFERLTHVRRAHDPVFITKAAAKNR